MTDYNVKAEAEGGYNLGRYVGSTVALIASTFFALKVAPIAIFYLPLAALSMSRQQEFARDSWGKEEGVTLDAQEAVEFFTSDPENTTPRRDAVKEGATRGFIQTAMLPVTYTQLSWNFLQDVGRNVVDTLAGETPEGGDISDLWMNADRYPLANMFRAKAQAQGRISMIDTARENVQEAQASIIEQDKAGTLDPELKSQIMKMYGIKKDEKPAKKKGAALTK